MIEDKKILVFAGPSGVGKSTLCNMVIHQFPEKFAFAVSATTRPIRMGETNGKNYHFLSEEEFKQKIANDEFIEHEEVYPGRFYGTLKSEIERVGEEGKKIVLDIDVLGALNIKKAYGDDAHIVFVRTESIESLEKRLRDRGSDSEEDIATRIARFEKELSYENQFDSVVVNRTGDIDGSREQIHAILEERFPALMGISDKVMEL